MWKSHFSCNDLIKKIDLKLQSQEKYLKEYQNEINFLAFQEQLLSRDELMQKVQVGLANEMANRKL